MARSNPRYYSGTGPTAHPLGGILGKWLHGFEQRVQDRPEKIFAAWNLVVGPRISSMSRPLSFQGGVLTIHVANSTLLSLLAGSEKLRIIQQLKQQHRLPIKSIRFTRG